MSYKSNTTVNLLFFPNTISTNYVIYPETLISEGVGETPLMAYQNSIYNSHLKYDAEIVQYIINLHFPDLQIESNVQSVIIKQSPEPFTYPTIPSNIFSFNNSPKNTVVVRNNNNTTSQNTSTAFYSTDCLFAAYYIAFNAANLNENVDANSICCTSYITSTNK
jgi:hypothetical protein